MIMISRLTSISFFFFFNDTATTEIYTLSLHDALPISDLYKRLDAARSRRYPESSTREFTIDRKSTRLNSSHLVISYAVFCLKKKKTTTAPSISPPLCPTHPTHSPSNLVTHRSSPPYQL